MPSGPPGDGGGPLEFAYHRALAPMMWMFLSIAIAEMLLAHALIAMWRPRIAAAFSILTLLSILWLARFIFSLRRHPVLLGEEEVRFRLGNLRDVRVPIDSILSVRTHWPARAHKRRQVLNLALLAFPNILVDLKAPLPGRVPRWTIAHRLDDCAGFVTELRRRLEERRPKAPPGAWFG